MMTRNDAVVMQQFCVLMTFNDALLVLSTKNDGPKMMDHLLMGVFNQIILRGWPARLHHSYQK